MRKLALFLVLGSLPLAVSAQTTTYHYVAKYVCGKSGGPPPNNFLTGFYATSINVHSLKGVHFKKRFTLSLPGEKTGGVTPWVNTGLPAGESMQIDCDDILTHLTQAGIQPPASQAAEGFVVIQVLNLKLDVVGVYSAGQQGGPVATLTMERVPPR